MADLSTLPSIDHLIRRSVKRTHDLFTADEFLSHTDSDWSFVLPFSLQARGNAESERTQDESENESEDQC